MQRDFSTSEYLQWVSSRYGQRVRQKCESHFQIHDPASMTAQELRDLAWKFSAEPDRATADCVTNSRVKLVNARRG